MKFLYRFFSSPQLALILLLVFALAMGTATFIENDFGTGTAWSKVYNAIWFELVMAGLGLCFIANIFKYRLWRKEKWSILLFHLSFIIILIGAGITRYHSYGGIMRIREGSSSNIIISDKNYFRVDFEDKGINKYWETPVSFYSGMGTNFSMIFDWKDHPVKITYRKYIPDARPEIVEDQENGYPLLKVVVTTGNGRETLFLKKGEIEELGRFKRKLGFEAEGSNLINLFESNGTFQIHSTEPLDFFVMADQSAGVIKADTLQTIKLKNLYRLGDISFIPLSFHPKGRIELVPKGENNLQNDKTLDDVLLVNVERNGIQKEVALLYREGHLPPTHGVSINGLGLKLSYGAKPIDLPFFIKLRDFQLERYPGSESPSSYASEVVVVEDERATSYRIFMNNVLDYGGYRFYQASYDTDEKGTVLSVNHDVAGTYITYLGYFLMMTGMFFTLFGKKSRFILINQRLRQLKATKKRISATLIIGLFSLTSFAQKDIPIDVLVAQQQVERQHSDLFGRLMVQDLDGRIKPVNTLASEFLRKVSRRPYFKFELGQQKIRLDANQVFLTMHVAPKAWQHIPIIKIDVKKGRGFFENLKVNKEGLIAFNDLIDLKGEYVLSKKVQEANAKKPAEQSEFDKEILKVDERFNILFNIFSGNYLKIFPNRLDENDTWFSYNHHFSDFPSEDARFIETIMPNYFEDIIERNWKAASEKLSYISTYQSTLGAHIIPSTKRREAEIWYNAMNLNFWLFQAFFTIGSILLVLVLVRIFKNNRLLILIWNIMVLVVLVGFLVFSGNILLRWFVAGHAPWSNGYEMLVFVAWVLMLCGLMTFRKSDFALPLATLFSGSLLLVSYLDWLNPEITNLMPVLKSFWLKVHVATIVSSYAPLALSAVIGLMALILMILRTDSTHKTIGLKIRELTYINEISMTIGLFVLSVGTFLGAVWANESWGRYWAWDPKETWALISIIVYAVVLHLRFIPSLRSDYVLNLASVIAFGSIIMTSFGVNYYLSGLHSYAAGDPLPIPKFIYVILVVVLAIATLAYIKRKKKREKTICAE
ncbi:cytochrome c biogenesis protein CcsA [Ulvibacterium sp.]|uniref:cytochrome c biogenesis protein CcsA n=1 Tax=Ulvibacterium sp. TaxID=2665914 RepID=UPI00261857B2|nr:cytochrome c biogenesis protein CcsA [Ulvibacterium sp.]